jgi:hypothetical protein
VAKQVIAGAQTNRWDGAVGQRGKLTQVGFSVSIGPGASAFNLHGTGQAQAVPLCGLIVDSAFCERLRGGAELWP